MEIKIKPLSNRVIIETAPPEEKTAGGIIIPDTAKEKPQVGKVVAVGPGKWEHGAFITVTVAVGDSVLYGKYTGTEIVIDGKTYLMMNEPDIFGTV